MDPAGNRKGWLRMANPIADGSSLARYAWAMMNPSGMDYEIGEAHDG